jgi:hypothetical protein
MDGGPVSADQPLTGDELDMDRLREWARGVIDLSGEEARAVVAEVERLRAQVDALVELAATADRPSSDDEWWMGRADALDDVRRILGKP